MFYDGQVRSSLEVRGVRKIACPSRVFRKIEISGITKYRLIKFVKVQREFSRSNHMICLWVKQ